MLAAIICLTLFGYVCYKCVKTENKKKQRPAYIRPLRTNEKRKPRKQKGWF